MPSFTPSKPWAFKHKPLKWSQASHFFDLLTTAIVVLDTKNAVLYANTIAQDLLELSILQLHEKGFPSHFQFSEQLEAVLQECRAEVYAIRRLLFSFVKIGKSEPIRVLLTVSTLPQENQALLLEFVTAEQQLRVDRAERTLEQSQANKALIRNLAHEIKNPLGGIRGAAQLLEAELDNPDLHDYTQVIIKESDRLQSLVDRLLAPHRKSRVVAAVNIHEICERVRSVLLAQYPRHLLVLRDYDTSIPEFRGDKEQLIQAVLNVAQNAAQALADMIAAAATGMTAPVPTIRLRTRIARQVTIARRRYKLALELRIIDNGSGIAPELLDKIFLPLVSGRDGGSGLGLTLAQTFIQQHDGLIECVSEPGLTDFRIVLPLP